MRKVLFSLFLCLACTMQAQEILVGDMTDDNQLSMGDVSTLVNTILGKTPARTVKACSCDPLTADNKAVTWSSSNNSAVIDLDDGEFYAKAAGTATITAAIAGTTLVASTEVTVTSKPAHEYVDLGLPSGTLWATCNIGAENPEDYGDYFAWGETTGYNSGKTTFNWSTYKWCSNGSWKGITKYTFPDGQTSGIWYSGSTFIGDNKTELDPEDDAAYVNWGSEWRMPTHAQLEELVNSSYTTTTWTTLNGVYGRKISKKSDSNVYIFLPAAGYRSGSSLYDAGSYGYYWSRSLRTSYSYFAYCLLFNSGNIYTYYYSRYYGRSVRPVFAK